LAFEETAGISAKRGLDRWRDWVAIAVMVSSAPSLALIFTATGPVLPLIAKHFAPDGHPAFTIPGIGLPVDGPFFAQMLGTLPSVGLCVGGAAAGFAIDRFGSRRVLLWAIAAFALFGSAGLYIDNAVGLLASRFALGFAAIAYGSATIAMIGNRFDDIGRARTLSWRNILGGISGIISITAAGGIAYTHGWHGVFALFLVPLVMIPATLFGVAPAAPRGTARNEAAAKESLLFLWPILTLAVFLAVVMMMNTTQFQFLLAENGVTDPKELSHVMLAGTIMSMVGSLLYSLLGLKIGFSLNYSISALLLGLGVMTVGLSHGPLVAAMGGALTGTGSGWLIPHLSRTILARTPASARGRAVGFFFFAIYLGDLINPIVIRPISLQLGLHRTFFIIGGIVALSALQILLPRGKKVPANA
jgi:MFS family permease